MNGSLLGIAGNANSLKIFVHEIRNPIGTIKTAVRLLKELNQDNDEVREFLDILERQSDLMTQLVNDIYLEGEMSINREIVSVAQLMKESVETAGPAIECANHELIVRGLADDSVCVLGDHLRLLQVFSNLLNNAGKYTNPGGRILFECRVEKDQVLFQVQDNGIGISQKNLLRIFSMFHQEKRSRTASGSGIGLSLVKDIVNRHDGTVQATSDGEGKGSSFLVTLPRLKMNSSQEVDSKKLRVIVMDDMKDAASSLSSIMEHMGYESRAVFDGLQGIELAETFQPDIALIDIQMPIMGGVETAQMMAEKYPKCLLIAITGYNDVNYNDYFDHQMEKPVNLKILMNHIENSRV